MQQQDVCEAFLRDGYVIRPVDDREALERIRDFVVARTAAFIGVNVTGSPQHFLDTVGDRLPVGRLNDLRLALIDELLAQDWFRPAYFACGRTLLETVVGNELAMQRAIGLSIQLPADDSSLLPLHSDVWSEDSPYEVVLWIPLVDCYRTKSMFLLPPAADAVWRSKIRDFAGRGAEALFTAVERDLQWLDVPFGQVLLFTHTLMHGNRVNIESTARWSMNCRFKGLFTPYSDKQLGEFFEPLNVRPATRIGLTYELPGGFGEV